MIFRLWWQRLLPGMLLAFALCLQWGELLLRVLRTQLAPLPALLWSYVAQLLLFLLFGLLLQSRLRTRPLLLTGVICWLAGWVIARW